MNTLEQLSKICEQFIAGEYKQLEEFQSRLETLLITDDLKGIIGKDINQAINTLEKIRFCSLLLYQEGCKVAQALINRVEEIRKNERMVCGFCE